MTVALHQPPPLHVTTDVTAVESGLVLTFVWVAVDALTLNGRGSSLQRGVVAGQGPDEPGELLLGPPVQALGELEPSVL